MLKLASRYKLHTKTSYDTKLFMRSSNLATRASSTKNYSTAVVRYTNSLTQQYSRHHHLVLAKCVPAMSLSTDLYHQSLLKSREIGARNFHTSWTRYECNSSKVDETVKALKNKQKEKVEDLMKEAASSVADASTPSDTKEQAVASQQTQTKAVATKKKPLGTRIWEELVHYYHGFRLLFIDIGVCARLVWRVLNGKTLTRRENKLLTRTSADIFRLIPFSIFVVVPFLELLLPLFIKFFPGMLPSTFQTAKDHDDKLKQALQVKLEMAKFLQRTLDEMPTQHKEHKSEEAKNFDEFFTKIKDPNAYVANEDIIKYAKFFNDEITLDSLSREQLSALCRVLELNTIGTSNLLRFQLRLKLRSLSADDRVISREGVGSLNLFELQQACKARGMRAYGLTEERLRSQLQEWIDLSLNEKVPPTLLLLSRTMHSFDDNITTDKLKKILCELPESVAEQTKAAIGENVGKIDNKTKINVIKEEERKIREEREEEREERREIKAKQDAKQAEPIVVLQPNAPVEAEKPCDPSITRNDVQLLSDALKSLSSDTKMSVEKETIKEIKEELQEYKEDVEELNEVGKVVKEPIKERRAAKLLYKKVNTMIDQLDKVLCGLEAKKQQKMSTTAATESPENNGVQIDELVETVRKLKASTDETQFKQLEDLLSKLDSDKDGLITATEVQKFVQTLPKSCPQIDEKYFSELITLLDKHARKRRMQEVVRVDELIQSIKKLKETSDQARVEQIGNVLEKLDDDKDGVITVNEVLKVVESLGRENVNLTDKQIEELIGLMEKEQIIEAEEKIEKALAKSERDKAKQKDQQGTNCNETSASACTFNELSDFKDPAGILKDPAIDLDKLDKEKTKTIDNKHTDSISSQAAAAVQAQAAAKLEKPKDSSLPKGSP